jgi:hypothetical protein
MVIKPSPWDAPALLEMNRKRMIRRARQRMREFEARYGIRSDDLACELTAGRLRESAEVGEWLIAVDTYQALIRE